MPCKSVTVYSCAIRKTEPSQVGRLAEASGHVRLQHVTEGLTNSPHRTPLICI